MRLNDHLQVWNSMFVHIRDIRDIVVESSDKYKTYRLPSSAFIYIVRGSARVWLDNKLHLVQRFHLFHGGKGLELTLLVEEEIEYYLILYQVQPTIADRQEIAFQVESYQYAFSPRYPIILYDRMEGLLQAWQSIHELDRLQVRSLFYQFIYELHWQLQQQEIEPIMPDRFTIATRYIHENYAAPLTLELIAEVLDCSVGHLSRLFKSKMDASPMHYLGMVRVRRTMELLQRTDATLQEIAERVGFADAYSLSRSFKKYMGISPTSYRRQTINNSKDQELPCMMQRYAVLKNDKHLYTDTDNNYQYHLRGEKSMQGKTKLAAMTMVLCMTLLLGACTSTGSTNAGQQSSNKGTTEATTGSSNNGQQTKQIEQATTRTIATVKGDVEVPLEPQRVAADQYMGHLLKLGIKPIGVRTFMLSEGWLERAGITADYLADVEDLGGFPMNLEKLTYLEPDLIIGSVEDNIEQYEKIGTTVHIPYWEGESTAGPLEKFRRISQVFGKEKEAEEWISEYLLSAETARKQIEGVVKEGETVSVVQIADKAIYVLAAEGGNYGSSTIYEILQLAPTELAANMKEGFESVSQEVLPQYLGDHIFVYNGQPDPIKQLFETEMWKGIPAVKNNHVYLYGNEFNDEFVMEDPFSLELQLETIVQLLLEGGK